MLGSEADADYEPASLLFRAWESHAIKELFELKDPTDKDFFPTGYFSGRMYDHSVDHVYGFQWYDGKPMDEGRVVELVDQLSTSNKYIRENWEMRVCQDVTGEKEGEAVSEEEAETSKKGFLDQKM